jgi:protein phosphatase
MSYTAGGAEAPAEDFSMLVR